jgi:hypothetical protein
MRFRSLAIVLPAMPLAALVSSACLESSVDVSRPTLTIAKPADGSTLDLTPTDVDVDLSTLVTNFTLVPEGQEGDDAHKGQIRVWVDGMACNDPGDGDAGRDAAPYNRIFPNARGVWTINMSFCQGGASALAGTWHTLRADLWHGEMALGISQQLTFKTNFHQNDQDVEVSGF